MSKTVEIEQKIVDILKADSRFDDIKVFFLGTVFRVETQLYPNVEVVTMSSDFSTRYTGPRQRRMYRVEVRFFDRYQDILEPADRQFVVPSSQAVKNWCDDAQELLSTQTNRDLQNFSGTDYVVEKSDVRQVSFGFSSRDDRPDNIDNFGIVALEITAIED